MAEKATTLPVLSILRESTAADASSDGEQATGQPQLAEARPWSAGLLENPSRVDHVVQFYEDDNFLIDAVAHFAAAG